MDFVVAINTADVDKLYSLMTDNHIFIDSHNNKATGRDNLKQAWIGYFAMFPDYKIEINQILEKDSFVCAFAWRAIVKDDKIKLWQVYADNIKALEIINKNK